MDIACELLISIWHTCGVYSGIKGRKKTNKNTMFVRKPGNQDFGSTSPQPLPPKIGANNATRPKLSKNVPNTQKPKIHGGSAPKRQIGLISDSEYATLKKRHLKSGT